MEKIHRQNALHYTIEDARMVYLSDDVAKSVEQLHYSSQAKPVLLKTEMRKKGQQMADEVEQLRKRFEGNVIVKSQVSSER